MCRIVLALALLMSVITPTHTEEILGYFTVEVTPPGDPPLWVREAWVGLRLPYMQTATCNADIISGKPTVERLSYFVSQTVAIELLEKRSPKAAQWWRDHGFPHGSKVEFCFAADPAVAWKPLPPWRGLH